MIIAFIIVLLFPLPVMATTVGQALEQCQLHVHVPVRGQLSWDNDNWRNLCIELVTQAGHDPIDPNRSTRLNQDLTPTQQALFDSL